jgi:VIT1/CCC1 family predicted Fe2+/Mn2+ transporter
MPPATAKKSFISTYLTPADSLSEIIFGLIMVLGFTSTARIALGEQSPRQFLLAVIGCNLAWGIVDGVMYILTSVYERSQRARLADSIRQAPDEATALAIINEELDPVVGALLADPERAQVAGWVLAKVRTLTPQPLRITQDDLYGALASGLLVFLATLPVAAPFLLVDDPWQALRLSNLVCVLMLFVVGYRWAWHTRTNPVVAGLALMVIGLVMVAVTVALGG